MRVNTDVSKAVISAVPKEQSQESQKKNGKVVSAASVQFNKSAIELKRERAGKQAAKLLMDAYARTDEADAGVQKMRNRITELGDTIKKDRGLLADGEKRIQDLAAEYKVDPDSNEQKDLDFYTEMSDRLKENGFSIQFATHEKFRDLVVERGVATNEELDRLTGMEKNGLTNYQKSVYEQHEINRELSKEIDDAEKAMVGLSRGIDEVGIDRLKNNTGRDAKEQAAAVLDAAGREIMGMIQAEVKDNIDESVEETREEGKEYREIRDEREARLEEQKEKRKAEEELLEEALADFTVISGSMNDIDQVQANVNLKIDSMLSKASLLPEDIKGTNVDEQL